MGKKKFNNGLSPFDYASNILSMAGTGMTAGGPIGAGIGAIAGLGFSIYGNNKANEFNDKLKASNNIANNKSLSDMVRYSYDMNSGDNYSIPGFDNGLSSFTSKMQPAPNSYVSRGEVIKDPIYGTLSEVPGEYSRYNPDTVSASLSPGSSVFSANPKNKLPFGKSTPADIASKMAKAQRKAEKTLSSSPSQIDRSTAELNKKNIKIQSENLDKITYLQHMYQNPISGVNKFDNGKTPWWIQGKEKWTGRNMDKLQGKTNIETDQMYDDYVSRLQSAVGSVGELASLAPVLQNLSDSPEFTSPIFSQYMNPMLTYNVHPELSDIANQSRVSRYNQSKLGGAGMAYGIANYGQSVASKSKLMSSASRFNADQKSAYADRFNRSQDIAANELRRIQDINMRNRAASRTANKAGLSQLSQYSQNKELMRNQAMNDMMNANIWGAYASDMDPALRSMIIGEISRRTAR